MPWLGGEGFHTEEKEEVGCVLSGGGRLFHLLKRREVGCALAGRGGLSTPPVGVTPHEQPNAHLSTVLCPVAFAAGRTCRTGSPVEQVVQ